MNRNRLLFAAIICSCYFVIPFVVASTDDDLQETETAAVHVPTFISKPKNLFVEEGATVELECQVDRLDPYVLMWKKGMTLLFIGLIRGDPGNRIELVDATDPSRLRIRDVTTDDEGEYVCEIGTSIKVPLQLKYVLRIQKEPHIKPEPPAGDVTAFEGQNVILVCAADGRPQPKVTWKTEEFDVKKGNILNGGDTLVFDKVVETDAGQYECIASNGVGKEARVVYRLRVSHAPKITIEERLVSTAGPPSLELICKVKADPLAKEVSWLRGSQPVTGGERVHVHASGHTLRLKFTHLNVDDFGNYTCAATNDIGVARETVHVSGQPHQVKMRSRQQGSERETYILEFTTQSVEPIIDFQLLIREAANTDDKSTPPPPWREVVIPGKEKSPLRYSDRYEITGLTPATVYEVVVKARNSVGWSDPSETFKFATLGADLEKLTQPPSTTTDKSAEVKSELKNKDDEQASGEEASSSKTSVVVLTVALLVALF